MKAMCELSERMTRSGDREWLERVRMGGGVGGVNGQWAGLMAGVGE